MKHIQNNHDKLFINLFYRKRVRVLISWIYLEVFITVLEVLYRNMARS